MYLITNISTTIYLHMNTDKFPINATCKFQVNAYLGIANTLIKQNTIIISFTLDNHQTVYIRLFTQ